MCMNIENKTLEEIKKVLTYMHNIKKLKIRKQYGRKNLVKASVQIEKKRFEAYGYNEIMVIDNLSLKLWKHAQQMQERNSITAIAMKTAPTTQNLILKGQMNIDDFLNS